MIVDSSALLAILKHGPDAERYSQALQAELNPEISAATFVETSVVAGAARHADLDRLLSDAGVELRPVDGEQARIARQAYLRFGKGSGSPAPLNLGDCFSYVLATVTGRPLLFKGDAFAHTDVTPAHRPD